MNTTIRQSNRTIMVTKPKTKEEEKEKAKIEDGDKAKLEHDYIVRRFYESGPVTLNWSILLVVWNVLLSFYPGARYIGLSLVIYWSLHYVIRRYTQRYRKSPSKEKAMNIYRDVNAVLGLLLQIPFWMDEGLASVDGRKAYVCLILLFSCFVGAIIARINAPRCHKHYPSIPLVVIPLLAFQKPRLGIFWPHYEALAFFVAFGTAELLGFVIDEMQWRHFVSNHAKDKLIATKSKALRRESRKKEMAIDAMASFNDSSSFFEILEDEDHDNSMSSFGSRTISTLGSGKSYPRRW